MLKSDAIRNQAQLEHLAQVHALTRAMQSAIAAIEKNDLPQFQGHLAVQETICNRLACNREALSPTSASMPVSGGGADPESHDEIRRAYFELARVNRVYAEIVKRAQKSVELLAAIYCSHGTGYGRGLALQSSRTWSCEV